MSKDHIEGQNAGMVFQLGRSLCFPGVKRQSEDGIQALQRELLHGSPNAYVFCCAQLKERAF